MKNHIIQHYVFNTYKTRSILFAKDLIQFLYKAFYEIAKTKGFTILACKILEDHVHCLIKYKAEHKTEYPIKMLKGISARMFFKAFRTNRYIYRKLWARSYFASEIKEEEEINSAVNYIKTQIDSTGFDKRYNKAL